MTTHEHLIKRFETAGLRLEVTTEPFVRSVTGRGGREIVQIDIQRKIKGSTRQEWFRIFPGHEDNRIEVVGTDKRIGQLVLMVHEPPREFEEIVPTATLSHVQKRDPDNWLALLCKENNFREADVKIQRSFKGRASVVSVKRKTSSQKRHFLVGLDERQLFIAQLPKAVSTVRDAHVSLKRTELILAEGKMGKATRQGEFFFVPTTAAERAKIETGLLKNLIVVEHQAPIGPFLSGNMRGGKKIRQVRGNPHTADDLIVIPGDPPLGGTWAVRSRELFIRGKVRHVDHETVSFSQWVKVILNAEPNAGQALGVGWVD
jgi:hypothetical protein